MTYLSPTHRAVPLPHSRNADDVPDAASSLPPRRGEFDYGHGEGVVRAMLPKSDPDHWEPSDAYLRMAESRDGPTPPLWWDLMKRGTQWIAIILFAMFTIGVIFS